jgi:ABC-2 type transport system permease protein
MLGLLLAPAVMMAFLNPQWQRWLFKLAPSTAGQSIQSTVDLKSLPIGPWAGLAVAAAWAIVVLGAGALTIRLRDV